MINQNNLPFKTKITGIIFFMISLEIYNKKIETTIESVERNSY